MSAQENISPLPESAVPALLPVSPVRGALRQIPFRVSAMIRLHGLLLKDLKTLSAGHLLLTETSATNDVPVTVGGAAFAFAELDNVDGQMALRLTRLS